MQTENNSTQNNKNKISLLLYIGGAIVAIMGISLLINNIILYNQTIAEYVAQGYDSAEVVAQMPPTQLLPIVFQAIGLYGGLSIILFSMGMIFQKLSNFMNQPAFVNQPIVEEVNLESLLLNVVEETEIPEDLEPVASSIPETSDAETEIPQSDENKTTTV